MMAKALVWLVTSVLISIDLIASTNQQFLYRNERAAVGDSGNLWDNGNIYYTLDSSISPRLQNLIEEAMTEWKNLTCLQFLPRNQEDSYVRFFSHPNEEYCTCNSVGKQGGEQVIRLGYSCQSKGELLHTIGHVIGLWHEQARPDRDEYVQILKENIDEGQEDNFKKRNEFSIDYQGTDYDFGSIMHLGAVAYSKNGDETIIVLRKHKEYGEYLVGQREELSDSDIKRVNTLYKCPSKSVEQGKLRVSILNVTLYTLLNAIPQVEVTAVDSNGGEMVFHTSEMKIGKDDIKTSHQQELMEFPVQEPKDWQFFRIRILAGAQQNENQLAVSKTVHITPGEYREFMYCINVDNDCDEYVQFGYQYILDGNECDLNPCIDGNCTDLFADSECTCEPGYYGDLCEFNRCESNPCKNGGTCELDSTTPLGYSCRCSSLYCGDQCHLNRCECDPCQNGGTCELSSSSLQCYTCSCISSHYGDHCEHNRCELDPCQNGGTCELSSTNSRGYTCSCNSGYYGDQCEQNHCEPNPCENRGTCELSSTNYTCSCSSSFYGDHCQHNRCDPNPCENHGTCLLVSLTPQGYICLCGRAYFGDLCQNNRCEPNPCQNDGMCELTYTNLQGYTCNCNSGYFGDHCEHNRCEPSPCQNGGTCKPSSTNYTCICSSSFYGDHCQNNRCDPNPCQNGGICELTSTNSQGYTCNCVTGHYGLQCQHYDYCHSHPCLHGGRCRTYSHGYTCTCNSYYYGDRCQLRNPCYPTNPCKNGGRCVRDSQGNYECRCQSGFIGTNCELRNGRLRFYARYGIGLPDTDSWFAGNSDPYVRVVAYNSNGYSTSKRTDDDSGDESPTWNEWLDFGVNTWIKFTVRVYDEDVGSDDSLSSTITYTLSSHISRNNVRMNCNRGYIIFNYEFQP